MNVFPRAGRATVLAIAAAFFLVTAACQPPEGSDVPEDVAEGEDGTADEGSGDGACEIAGIDSIQIGGLGALSGAHADYGAQMEMGAEMAADEINEQGGMLGCEVEIRFMDSELDPEVAIGNARNLVGEWGAEFLVGVDSSGVALALAPVMDELDRVLVVTHAATEKLNEEEIYANDHRNVFRMSVPVYQDAVVAALIVAEMPEITRIANIGADYEYGRTAWAMFQETLSQYRDDVEFVAEAWAPFLTSDFSPHVSSVMAEEPDMVFSTPWAGEAVALIRQAQQSGAFQELEMWWQAMGASVDVLEAVTPDVQADAFEGKLWATGRYIFNWPETDTNREWVEAFQERYDRLPNYSAQTTYTAVNALHDAVEAAGSVDPADVGAELEGMIIDAPAGEFTLRAEDHQAVYPVPAGRVVYDDDWGIACVCADLQVFDTEEYYRDPPFEE
ncbi:MAG: ABC transporter substrate-binding protein [Propionibacteriales bacterium]|nr:ABC transporter substrate-binding protein [Propionibacteriales bacterium]